ncbi:MAG: hypothetical protein COB46_09105 [Rhodospirillaceae bacterium]|nr:MAG: hypothetical protein COB46_09105 [Rhodospirillaceae bacterium]
MGQESRHNLTYWQGHDYLGIGPGAHGRLTQNHITSARHQIADPLRWQTQITDLGHGTAKTRILSNQDRLEERILSGLRLTDGIDCEVFATQTGLAIMDAVDADALAFLQGEGLVKLSPKTFKVTPKGRLVVSAIIEKLLV